MAETYTIAGESVEMPVEIRSATTWVASFAVSAEVAQRMIDYSGFGVATTLPGRAMVNLAVVRYADGDLGPYHELGVTVMVDPPDPGPGVSKIGAFIHQLPVNQSFTLAAGREIWGFPKWMARIDLADGGRRTVCKLYDDEAFVLSLSIARGVPMPARNSAVDAYSWLDGVRRRTKWQLHAAGARGRPGGARLELGDHPMAKELHEIGLPRRALFAGSVARVRMTFGPPEVLR